MRWDGGGGGKLERSEGSRVRNGVVRGREVVVLVQGGLGAGGWLKEGRQGICMQSSPRAPKGSSVKVGRRT
jgi:hypothetical protein